MLLFIAQIISGSCDYTCQIYMRQWFLPIGADLADRIKMEINEKKGYLFLKAADIKNVKSEN
jgi:hypothetical protein